jgi:hypothetical protein
MPLFLLKIPSLIALVLLTSSCASDSPTPGRNRTAGVIHVVLCWLKEPGNEAHRRAVIERSRQFRYMPGVIELHTGPVIESDRAIVDDSFDVGVHLRFDSLPSMRRYLADPVHVRAVRDVFRPLCGRIQVFDFRDR